MADHDRARAQAPYELFQVFQAGQVEVVRGLVQQEDVVARQEQRGQLGACGLSAGQGRHGLVQADPETERRGDLFGALVQVGSAQGQPALQAGGVRVVRSGHAVGQGLGGEVQSELGGGDTGAAREEAVHAFAGAPVRLLREMADGRTGRSQVYAAFLGPVEAGEEAQEGGLARAVGSDEADHFPRRHGQVEAGEQGEVAVAGREIPRCQGCGHEVTYREGSSPEVTRNGCMRNGTRSAGRQMGGVRRVRQRTRAGTQSSSPGVQRGPGERRGHTHTTTVGTADRGSAARENAVPAAGVRTSDAHSPPRSATTEPPPTVHIDRTNRPSAFRPRPTEDVAALLTRRPVPFARSTNRALPFSGPRRAPSPSAPALHAPRRIRSARPCSRSS